MHLLNTAKTLLSSGIMQQIFEGKE